MQIQKIYFSNNSTQMQNNKHEAKPQFSTKNDSFSFTSGYNSGTKSALNIIADSENKIEKALEKIGFFDKLRKPEPFTESLTEVGTKLRTYTQNNGKTGSTVELDAETNKKIASIFYDLDGETKLLETQYKPDESMLRKIYYKSDGITPSQIKEY